MPNKEEQMARYYGYYSNVSREKRKTQEKDYAIPSIIDTDGSSKEYRKKLGSANLEDLPFEIPERGSAAAFHRVPIKVDPLTCPKCR